jgi:hypothetical protein
MSAREASSTWESPRAQAPFADGLTDQVRRLRLGMAFSIVRAVAPRGGLDRAADGVAGA